MVIQPIEFAKLSGSGNDFICIDNRDRRFDPLLADAARVGRLAQVLCQRGLSVGADGVIFAEQPTEQGMADVRVRFFEPDGSEAELCGNGGACFTRWAVDSGWIDGSEVHIETASGGARGRIGVDGYVWVCIPSPHSLETDIRLTANHREWLMDFAVTGVPHAVVYVDDIEDIDMHISGPAIRSHERFGERGVNANFTQVLGPGRLAVRTFEFGVESETLACGTGCATAGLMSALRFEWGRDFLSETQPVEILVRSGDILRVSYLVHDGGVIESVCLETVVRALYTGRLHPDLVARALGEKQSGE